MLLIPAYAKVNLCLTVRGRRADGFHDIDSVAATIDWHDLVGLRAARSDSTAVRLRVTGIDPGGVPADGANLAARAATVVAEVAGPLSVDIWLHKRIPTRAGLGGGSADAAAVLTGLATLLSRHQGRDSRHRLSTDAVHDLAAGLGADVPVLLAGGMQRMQGRGERLTALPAAPLHLAVAVAGSSDTAATYAATRSFDYEDHDAISSVMAALAEGRRPSDDELGSGLEAPACRAHPALDEHLMALRAALPEVRWHLTGSGGAAFALAGSAAEAEELADSARAGGFTARACRTVVAPRSPLSPIRRVSG